MTTKPLRKLLVAVGVSFITLVLLEATVRVSGYARRNLYDPIYTAFDRSKDIPYVHKPNLVQARARGLALINTDSLGLRARVAGASYAAKEPNEYRIAVVGDSYTFGEGVPRTEDTFAQVLEDVLNRRPQRRSVKVFNFGASAYSVKEMAATLEYRMLEIQPDLVLMAIIAADFNLKRTPTIDDSGYLIDRNLSFLVPPGSIASRALRQIHLLYVLRDIGARWLFPPRDMGRILSSGEVPESYRYVRDFKSMADQHGLPSMIVLLPAMRGKSWGSLPAQLARDRIPYVDLSSLASEFTQEQYMASRFDAHPSAAVHHRIGESLADSLQDRPGIGR